MRKIVLVAAAAGAALTLAACGETADDSADAMEEVSADAEANMEAMEEGAEEAVADAEAGMDEGMEAAEGAMEDAEASMDEAMEAMEEAAE